MNNLHYIGRRISSFELYDELGPITGVSLLLDDESEPINAGDATGYVLEISCPYGTQIMATEILSAVQGRTYKGFRAENAILDPLAELGDYLSIGGSTFLLAHRIATFGPGHMSEVSAPGENELEHEYAWVNPEKKEFNQKISYVRSEISKNSGEIKLLVERTDELGRYYSSITQSVDNITLEVQGLRGNFSSLSVEVDGIALEVHGENGDGGLAGQYTAIDQRVNNLAIKVVGVDGEETSVKLSDGQIDLSGLVTFSALSGENPGTTKINGGWIDTDTLTVTNVEIKGGSITWEQISDDAKEKMASPDDIPTKVSDLNNDKGYQTKNQVTKITEDTISTAYISANQITTGTLDAGEINIDGLFSIYYGSTYCGAIGATYTLANGAGATMAGPGNGAGYVRASGEGAKVAIGSYEVGVFDNGNNAGCFSTHTIQVNSDRRLKKNISYDLQSDEKLFSLLQPCSFEMNNEDGKKRWGFIAQDVISGVNASGMNPDELALIGSHNGMYSIAYGEVIALNTHMIQKLMSRVAELEERL